MYNLSTVKNINFREDINKKQPQKLCSNISESISESQTIK